MKLHVPVRFWPAILALAIAATAQAAPVAGGTAYTKRVETKLLAEPKPLAAATGSVGFAKKLTIAEVSGPWLRVTDGTSTGWVFSGNLAETAPEKGKGADGLGLSASATSATAAARPLTVVGNDYASRRNLVNARDDLDWLLEQCRSVTEEDVVAFLQEKKKGDFQEVR